MSQRDDTDQELSGIAMAAAHEHEVTVGADETEAALASVRARIAGAVDSPIPLTRVADRRRSPLIMFGAAAATVAVLVVGLVALVGGDDPASIPIASGDTDVPADVESAPAATIDASTEEIVPGMTAPVAGSAEPQGFVEQTIAVDAANPPMLVEPAVWRSIPIDSTNLESATSVLASVAISDEAVFVSQQRTLSITALDRKGDDVSQIPLEQPIAAITAGPFGTVYGLGGPVFDDDNQVMPRGFEFVGVSVSDAGPGALGDVFASVEVDVNTYLELPPYPFGTGDSGVIDRVRDVGATIIDFSDGRDGGFGSLGVPVPRFAVNGDGITDPASGRIEVPELGWIWNLDIRRDPTNADTFDGPSAPVPTSDGRVIYFDRIGADLTDGDDFGTNATPVIAILNSDGSGSWVRLPDDWNVVASDTSGTVLMRRTATTLDFALLDDVLAAANVDSSEPVESPEPATPVEQLASSLTQPTALPLTCTDEALCTQLAITESGRIVSLDPTGETFQIFDSSGVEPQAEVIVAEPIPAPFLQHIGPDDVAYVHTPTPGTDASSDLLAIPLIGSNAGTVVMRWTGLDGTGDSTLIPRKAGLTFVGCCGALSPRPDPDATIYRWVDRNGTTIESTAPSFDLTLGDAGSSLTRIDTDPAGDPVFTRFSLPTVLQYPRDFPIVVPTDDGGALASDFDQFSGMVVLVDFDIDWPAYGIDNADVYYLSPDVVVGSPVLEPTGTVIVRTDDGFVRRDLDEVAARGWPGEHRLSDDFSTITADGFNEYIDEVQPFWAADPVLFSYQFVQSVEANEQVQVTLDDADSPTISVVTTGLLGDSVEATQHLLVTERGDDGLLRFESGTYGFRCQPGRGQQDFSTEFCI